jgi:hypothetical protein
LNLDDQWIHTVIVCDYFNKILKFYRNGALFTTNTLTGTPVFPTTDRLHFIGELSPGWNRRITDGSLDEVRIYNRGLSEEEVSAHYTITKGKFGL